jgi:dolichyl-diphosphooligosaccharide--protein glycosyltransferase
VSRKRKLLSGEVERPEKAKPAHSPGSRISTYAGAHERPIIIGLAILLLALPLFLSIWFRAPTYTLPVADQWAQSTVYSSVRSSIAAQVSQQFPNLPASNRQQLVDQEFTKFLAQNGDAIKPQIEQTANYFRSQLQDANGHTYLPDLDTYFHLLRIEQILKNGFPGDVMRDGQPWNMYMLAPFGVQTYTDFYSWFVANVYKVAHAFNPSTTPMYTYFWMPLLFAALAVIPAFFIGKREGLVAAFFAAMLIAVHPSILSRTAAGFADNDILQVFFPLLIAWFFIEAFETPVNHWKRRAIWLFLTGLAFGLLAWAWEWFFFFDILLIVLIAHVIYVVIRHFIRGGTSRGIVKSKELRWSLVMLLGFLLLTGIFISLFRGASTFVNSPLNAISQTQDLKAAAQAGSIWPNVMTTVAELNEPDINGIIGSVGGKLLFLLALMGMLFALVPRDRLLLRDWLLLGVGAVDFLFLISPSGTSLPIFLFLGVMALPVALGGILLLKDDRNIDVKYAFFLIAWLAASVFTMTKGVRFVLLLIPPFVLAAAVAVGTIHSLLKEWLTKSFNLSRLWVAPVLFLVLSLLLYPVVVQGRAAGLQATPTMTTAWWNSLENIKEKSAPDAIINSWWDFGHWFKYIADRRVTFDGASQHGQLAHWIGRALITPDEKETMAILRMADCGSDAGTDDLQAALPSHDQYEAIMLTKQIILMRHEEAHRLLLSKGFTEAQAQGVLNHTHCDPPEDYFITSSDMIGKAGVWGHFGSWDFAKADAYANFRKLPQAEAVPAMAAKYNWTEEQASKAYYDMQTLSSQSAVNAWISPWPGYITGGWNGCSNSTQDPALLICTIGANLNQQQGTNTVLEGLVLNTTQLNSSFLAIGFYDGQGRKLGANNDVKPSSVILVRNSTSSRLNFTGNTFGQAFLVDLDQQRVLMTDPLHADSMFARLYFLDGRGTTAFQKFSDQSDFMGNRIVVWKVDWSKLKELGLE